MPVDSTVLQEILFVIVLYKRSPDQCPSFPLLQHLTENLKAPSIFIHDNSPLPCSTSNASMFYYHSPENAGVSKAYNTACRYARRAGKKWMMLLDQDTMLTEHALHVYLQATRDHADNLIFTSRLRDGRRIISPFREVWGKGKRIKKIEAGFHAFRNFRVINSGLLIAIDAFETAGGFDERFPLDFSDVVFSNRLQKHYPRFMLVDTGLDHSLSALEADRISEEDFSRFKSFINSAGLYKQISNKFVSLSLNVLPRSLKLAARHRDLKFFYTGLRRVL